MDIIKNKRILKAIGKKYGLEFDPKHHYYIGDAYKNNRGEYLSTFERDMTLNGRTFYKLQYFDGCFNPFLVLRPSHQVVVEGSVFFESDDKLLAHAYAHNTCRVWKNVRVKNLLKGMKA